MNFNDSDTYKEEILNKLFVELQQIVPLEEMGFHEIREGKLHPIHKTETSELSISKWKETHLKNHVYIKDNPLLIEVINDKKTIAISNTHQDERSSKAFGLFGIDSIMVIPIQSSNSIIKGLIIIPSIKKFYTFTNNEIIKSEDLVKKYSYLLV